MTTTRRAYARKVLCDCSGETLVETLVAVLISSLAMLMLAMAIMTSVRIVQSGKQSIEEYTREERALATVTGSEVVTGERVTITVDGASESDDVSVKYVAKTNLPGMSHSITVVSYKPTS